MKIITVVNWCLALALSTLLASADSYAMTPKPRPPVQFEIQSVPLESDPNQVQFNVTTVSSVALPFVEINVVLPASMDQRDGVIAWQGSLVANQAQLMIFTATVAVGNNDPIAVSAMLANGSVQKIIAVAEYTHQFIVPNITNDSIARATANAFTNTSVVIKQSEGRQIIEYALE